ncbi:androgen-dependent TFPI-regulating protein-like isoform X2 [Hetaerina americana]|uniref:androgen-dependent TFPI-regulating protein-like isoform X2 n=1 Tax=Hetaerina americana TaxID=62018 RepID=UPI003A7F578B
MATREFHVAAFGYNTCILCYWLSMNIPSEMNVNMPSITRCWWQYLTVWNMVFQHIYFIMCIVDDFLLRNTIRKDLFYVKERLTLVRDILFQSLVLPLAMFVFAIFWMIFACDRELVYPAALDSVIPFWFNHLLHTVIVFLPWAEMLICRRAFDQRKLRFLCGLAVVAIYNCMDENRL